MFLDFYFFPAGDWFLPLADIPPAAQYGPDSAGWHRETRCLCLAAPFMRLHLLLLDGPLRLLRTAAISPVALASIWAGPEIGPEDLMTSAKQLSCLGDWGKGRLLPHLHASPCVQGFDSQLWPSIQNHCIASSANRAGQGDATLVLDHRPGNPGKCTTHRGILQRGTAPGTHPLPCCKNTTSYGYCVSGGGFQPWGKGRVQSHHCESVGQGSPQRLSG